MPDYSKGKIYKIENDIDDEIYIGSTVQPLCKRWECHKRNCNNGESSKLYNLMREYGVEHFKIILVEEYPCDNVEQLTQKEAEYIKQLGTLNKYIPKKKDDGKNKYKDGKIYKITNDIDDEVYIGSTIQSLNDRWINHKSEMINIEKYPNSKLYTKIRELGVEHFKIELIEEYSCENLEELKQKEQQWIRTHGTLNYHLPGRTRKQYWEENKEKIIEVEKQYYETNKEQILEKKKIYRQNNIDKIREFDRHRPNKQERNEKSKQLYQCECGAITTKGHKARHNKSKKHIDGLKWLEQQNS